MNATWQACGSQLAEAGQLVEAGNSSNRLERWEALEVSWLKLFAGPGTIWIRDGGHFHAQGTRQQGGPLSDLAALGLVSSDLPLLSSHQTLPIRVTEVDYFGCGSFDYYYHEPCVCSPSPILLSSPEQHDWCAHSVDTRLAV